MKNPQDLLNEMNIEEKISLIVGAGLSRLVPGAAGETRGIPRLGVEPIVFSDGPAGVRIHPLRYGSKAQYYATSFPNAILLASTWNLELVEQVARAIGEEARANGIHVLLAPAINIHRLPICGRIFEYFSEDPILSGKMAVAYVRGVQSTGVGATLKHFVAHEQEQNRLKIDVKVSERALREIYLKPFEIAIRESEPWAIMAAYNKLNGRYCTQNPWLLINVLRGEWGFKGLVMTDWGAGDDHVEQIRSGVDLIMPGSPEIVERLLEAYRSGQLDEKTINERVFRVVELTQRVKTAEGSCVSLHGTKIDHSEIAYQAALEGIVLLKNNNALPIRGKSRVALFGRGSYLTVKGGLGSGDTFPKYTVSVADGLKERGIEIDDTVERYYKMTIHRWYEYGESIELYRKLRESALSNGDNYLIEMLMSFFTDTMIEYYRVINIQEDPFTDDLLEDVSRRNDYAIVTISRISTEGMDRFPLEGDYYLRPDEYRLLTRVSRAFHEKNKKVIVLLNVPGPIDLTGWQDIVDAILVIWLPGQEGGRAIADILLGKISPSGKLPFTWPKSLNDVPSMRTYPGRPRDDPIEVEYAEDIYVGYRYFDTFHVEPAYEFGFGLSYTCFTYRDLEVTVSKEDMIVVSLLIENTGSYPGKETVQIYVRPLEPRVSKPYQELKGFHKTRLLNPGETEDINIIIPLEYLATYDGRMWIIERGRYEIRAGASSRDIRLKKIIEIPQDICYDRSWKRTSC